jgi:NitT/TauT family transport system ATP-binding protein
VVGSTAFGGYVAQVWADLREEATRGLEESEARSRKAG